MTGALNIIAFLCVSVYLSCIFDEELTEAVPVTTVMLILTLFVLAFFRALFIIDFIAAAAVIVCLTLMWRRYGRNTPGKMAGILFSPGAIALYTMLIMGFLLLKNTCIISRDDYGCWAIEAGSIFHYDGFAPKYRNVAFAYGNYAPGTSLFRWWVCHLAGEFREGLLAVGSGWMVVLLAAPMLSCVSSGIITAPIAGVLTGLFLLFLPGVFDYSAYQSICAEPMLSAAFALGWITLLSEKKKGSEARLASYIVLLCLFKSSGILYAGLILVFCLIRKKDREPDGDNTLIAAMPGKRLLLGAGLCLIPTAIWYLYCLAMNRGSYYTLAAASEAGFAAYLRSWLYGLFTVPAHYTTDGILDLPLLALLLIIAILWIAGRKAGLFSGRDHRALGKYYLCMVAMMLVTVLMLHAFMFREPLYTEAASIAVSCVRYGQPLFMGAMLFLAYNYLSVSSKRKYIGAAVLLAVTMLCTCLWTVYYRVINTTKSLMQTQAFREELTEQCDPFLRLIGDHKDGRCIFVYGTELGIEDTQRTCIQYLASPCSVIPFQVDAYSDMNSQALQLKELILRAHPDSIYYTNVPEGFFEQYSPGELPEQNCVINIH